MAWRRRLAPPPPTCVDSGESSGSLKACPEHFLTSITSPHVEIKLLVILEWIVSRYSIPAQVGCECCRAPGNLRRGGTCSGSDRLYRRGRIE